MFQRFDAPSHCRRCLRDMAARILGLGSVDPARRDAARALAKRIIDDGEAIVSEFEAHSVKPLVSVPRIETRHVVRIIGFDEIARNVALCLGQHGIRNVDFVVDEPAMQYRSAIRAAHRMGFSVFFDGDLPRRGADIVIDCVSEVPEPPAIPPTMLAEVWPTCEVAERLVYAWGARNL